MHSLGSSPSSCAGSSPTTLALHGERVASSESAGLQSPASARCAPVGDFGFALSNGLSPSPFFSAEEMKAEMTKEARGQSSPSHETTKGQRKSKRKREEVSWRVDEPRLLQESSRLEESPARKGRREEDNPLRKMEQMTCASMFESSKNVVQLNNNTTKGRLEDERQAKLEKVSELGKNLGFDIKTEFDQLVHDHQIQKLRLSQPPPSPFYPQASTSVPPMMSSPAYPHLPQGPPSVPYPPMHQKPPPFPHFMPCPPHPTAPPPPYYHPRIQERIYAYNMVKGYFPPWIKPNFDPNTQHTYAVVHRMPQGMSPPPGFFPPPGMHRGLVPPPPYAAAMRPPMPQRPPMGQPLGGPMARLAPGREGWSPCVGPSPSMMSPSCSLPPPGFPCMENSPHFALLERA